MLAALKLGKMISEFQCCIWAAEDWVVRQRVGNFLVMAVESRMGKSSPWPAASMKGGGVKTGEKIGRRLGDGRRGWKVDKMEY